MIGRVAYDSPECALSLRYPDSWYRDITSNKKFFSLAATYRGAIVGMIVAEIKNRTKIHKEVCLCIRGLALVVTERGVAMGSHCSSGLCSKQLVTRGVRVCLYGVHNHRNHGGPQELGL